jgi:uncharacterized damage-inducible protein DinB
MNALDILKYGNQTVLKTLEGVPDPEWDAPNVCGWWSVKHIIAHLASFELVLIDVLNGFLAAGPTPRLDKYIELGGSRFNDVEVDARKDKSPKDVLTEYNEAQARARSLAARISVDKLREAATLPWYGMEYALDDLIVYQYYGHKREHCAQISVFKDTLK